MQALDTNVRGNAMKIDEKNLTQLNSALNQSNMASTLVRFLTYSTLGTFSLIFSCLYPFVDYAKFIAARMLDFMHHLPTQNTMLSRKK